jgi:hypothetical protein
MKIFVSVTIFFFATIIGATLFASGLLDRYGNIRKLTEVTRIHTIREKKAAETRAAQVGSTNSSGTSTVNSPVTNTIIPRGSTEESVTQTPVGNEVIIRDREIDSEEEDD